MHINFIPLKENSTEMRFYIPCALHERSHLTLKLPSTQKSVHCLTSFSCVFVTFNVTLIIYMLLLLQCLCLSVFYKRIFNYVPMIFSFFFNLPVELEIFYFYSYQFAVFELKSLLMTVRILKLFLTVLILNSPIKVS